MNTPILTLGTLSKQTGICFPTLRLYADAGWIDSAVDSSGRRLFGPAAVEQARQVFESRTGRKAAAA